MICRTLFNQLMFYPTAMIGYYFLILRGIPDTRYIPTIQQFILDFIVTEIFWEISYYYLHRLFHSKFLYKRCHREHHEFTAPYAIMTQYQHPVEYIFTSLLPPFVGLFIMGSGLITIYLFTIYAVIKTILHHSGYRLPIFPTVEFHDYHHKR